MSTRAIHATPMVPLPKPAPKGDLISINDLGPEGVRAVLELTALIKSSPADFRGALAGKHLALFFEKPSLRTRLTFEVGIHSLGGTSFFFDQTGSRLDAREKLSDIAHNLERWVDGIVLRTFDHATVTGIAEHASIPVVNGLSDVEHPCQALADYFTVQEKFGDLRKLHLAYTGDGNNVANSLLLTAACVGGKISIATPPGYEVSANLLAEARRIARHTGASIKVGSDPEAAVCGADAVYTDVWTSMGAESQAESRKSILAPYQVNPKLMAKAARHAVFMHCLPAHRGEEVVDAVMDSPRSVVFDQAENRLHVQKAILVMLLGGGGLRLSPRSAHA